MAKMNKLAMWTMVGGLLYMIMAKMNKLAMWTMVGGLLLATTQPAMSAIEIDEKEFGPDYGTMVGDAVVGKPLQFAAAVAGSVTYALSYPFSYYGVWLSMVNMKLVFKRMISSKSKTQAVLLPKISSFYLL